MQINKENIYFKYILKGVVVHVGHSRKFGHYYSLIKTDIKDEKSWHTFNDSSVYKNGEFPMD